jgi:hypothetical protein
MSTKINIRVILLTLLLACTSAGIFFPLSGHAQSGNTGVVIKCVDGPVLVEGGDERECGYYDLIRQVNKIIYYLFLFSIPLTAISFSYAGYLMLTAAGNAGKVSQARSIFGKVLTGFIFMLVAWILVKLIADNLVKDGFVKTLGQ